MTVFLARKISRAKWTPKEGLTSGEIPADAITADLRTMGNALSFWRCGEATEEEVEDAILAIAAGSERLDKIDVAWVSAEELAAESLAWKNTKGRTPVVSLVGQHVDVYRLDYVRLGKVAASFVRAVENGRHRRLTVKDVTRLVAKAVQDGRVVISDLEDKVREGVRRALGQDDG